MFNWNSRPRKLRLNTDYVIYGNVIPKRVATPSGWPPLSHPSILNAFLTTKKIFNKYKKFIDYILRHEDILCPFPPHPLHFGAALTTRGSADIGKPDGPSWGFIDCSTTIWALSTVMPLFLAITLVDRLRLSFSHSLAALSVLFSFAKNTALFIAILQPTTLY